MSESDEVLNIVQDVLKGLLIGLLAGTGADVAKFASGIQEFSEQPDIDPAAKRMLMNLATSPDLVAMAKRPPQ